MRNREILFIIKLRNEARRQLRGFNQDLQKLTRNAQNASKGIDQVSRSAKTAGRSAAQARGVFQNVGGTLRKLRQFAILASAALAAIGVGVGIGSLVQDFAAFDRGLIGVSKTTNIVGEELAGLGDRIQEISRVVPESQERLLAIAQAAGQLGITGSGNITKFTEVIGKLGLATNLAGEEAASALARILLVSGEPIENVDRLGSAIVDLGNNFAATEREIARAALRVARGTAQFNVSAADVAGIGTALVAVGVRAEEGGTVIGRAFQKISDAIRGSGEELQVLQDVTGLTAEALRQGFQEDPTAIFKALIEGLKQVNERGGSVAGALEAMGLEGVRVIGTLGTLAVRAEVLGRALRTSNEEFQRNTALNIEAGRAAEAFTAQLGLTRNAISEAAVVLGEELAPLLLGVARNVRDFIIEAKETGALKEFFQDVIGAVEFLASAFGILLRVAQGFIALKLAGVLARIATTAIRVGGAMLGLGLATGKAAVAFRTLLRAAAIGLIIEAIVRVIAFVEEMNTEVADGVKKFELFGAAVTGIFVAIGSAIGDVLGGFGKFLTAVRQAGSGEFKAALQSIRDGFEQIGDIDVDFRGAIEDQLRKLAIEARRDAEPVGVAISEAVEDGLEKSAPELVETGKKAAKLVSDGFLDGIVGLQGGREAFTRELTAIVTKFRPSISAAQEQARALDVLNLALVAGENRLRRFGLTQQDVKDLIVEVNQAQRQQLSLFDEELLKIDQRIALIGLSNAQKQVEQQLNAILNKARTDEITLTEKQIEQIKERLQLEQQQTAEAARIEERKKATESLNKSIDSTIARLRTEQRLLGTTGDELERERILIDLRNQAAEAGIPIDQQRLALLKQQITNLQQAKRELRENPFAGVQAGFREFIDEARDLNTQFKDFTTETLNGLKDEFNEFVRTGKLNFADLTASILANLQEIATNQLFAAVLGGGSGGGGLLGGLFGGGGGGGGGGLFGGILGSLFNKGGVVGKDGTPAVLAASAFKNAKKFQSGGPVSRRGRDRVPILASPGEIVLNEDQAGVLRNALAGRSVGTLAQNANRGGGGFGSDSAGNVEASVTVVVQGVADVEGFRRSTTQIAAETARATNRALQRNG